MPDPADHDHENHIFVPTIVKYHGPWVPHHTISVDGHHACRRRGVSSERLAQETGT